MKRKARLPLTMQRIEAATCPPGKAMFDLWDGLQPACSSGSIRPAARSTWPSTGPAPAGVRCSAGRAWRTCARSPSSRPATRCGSSWGASSRASIRSGTAGRKPKAGSAPRSTPTRRACNSARWSRRRDRMVLLRRELKPLGDVPLARIERSQIVDLITGIERSGRPGAAQDLRKNAAVFLGWAVDAGLLRASPLAGWRRPRRTRAQLVARPGRALEDWEIAVIWRAAEAAPWPFSQYLKMLIICGQRRGETAPCSGRTSTSRPASGRSRTSSARPPGGTACRCLRWRSKSCGRCPRGPLRPHVPGPRVPADDGLVKAAAADHAPDRGRWHAALDATRSAAELPLRPQPPRHRPDLRDVARPCCLG